ncbi:tetratricopeptide repeat protein [Coralloluteibacterium thermophilus]|uniref:Tetratricopeptide repeat protein n=1 Tax=Coralloluteibacterium thermophilum TaxID=2707049 RepID=A0ABV9NIB2_9GAMM
MLQPVIEALRRNDAPAALAAADAAVAAAPEDAAAAHLQGMARRLAGDNEGARSAFERAIELDPVQADYHLSLGALALNARDLAGARARLDRTVELDPNQLPAYLMLGHIALAAGDREAAQRQLKLAQRVDETHPHVRVFEAQLLLGQGDHQRALAILDGTVRVAPRDALVQSALALAYMAAGHHAFAEQALRNTLELNPDLVAQRRLLIESLRQQNRPDDVLVELDALLARHPDDAAAHAVRGMLLANLGRHEEAIAALERALALQPRDGRALVALLRLRQDRGEDEAARAFLDARLEDAAAGELYWQARVALGERTGEDVEALARRWRAAWPESPVAAETLALYAEIRGDLAEAETLAREVLERAPGALRARLLLYRIELVRDPDAAIALINALAEHPEPLARADFRRARGLAHARAERREQALADWGDAHAAAPVLPYAGPAALPAAAPAPSEAPAAAADAPILLWSPPGAGSALVVELLRRQMQVPMMGDRLLRQGSPRLDGLSAPQTWLDDPAHPGHAPGAFGEAWRQAMAQAGLAGATVIDWLAYWDARLIAPLRSELPGSRLVTVLRDPRDALLHWLAFGTPGHLRADAPEAAARALAASFEHLAATLEVEGFVQALRYEELIEAPEAAVATLSEVLGTPLEIDAATLASIVAAARPPRAFAPGAWRGYADVLGDAFAALHPVAERLGYPA